MIGFSLRPSGGTYGIIFLSGWVIDITGEKTHKIFLIIGRNSDFIGIGVGNLLFIFISDWLLNLTTRKTHIRAI